MHRLFYGTPPYEALQRKMLQMTKTICFTELPERGHGQLGMLFD